MTRKISVVLLFVFGISNVSSLLPTKNANGVRLRRRRRRAPDDSSSLLQLTPIEEEIGFWTVAFATTHIGMSAVRQDLIHQTGKAAKSVGAVGNEDWKLPDFWPGDEAGQSIFPTADIAGRQIYRIGYTFVSFYTLGSAFFAYLNSINQECPIVLNNDPILLSVATLSWAFSVASLVNPSPLSLVPVYEASTEDGTSVTPQRLLRRNDKQKLQPYGMTRITRHPLILPVVTWGFSTAALLGGNIRDYLFFGGLAMYAIAGCAAQDLRVANEEGSVGTIFNPDQSLQVFFNETSFVPFGAVVDGRQSIQDIIGEVPWWAMILVGIPVGYEIQLYLLNWLSELS
jgi:uncharacterized membrane protein